MTEVLNSVIRLATIVILLFTLHWAYQEFKAEKAKKQVKNEQAVDLPEEYMNLSPNSSIPDTVLAYYDNDTVHIEFIH